MRQDLPYNRRVALAKKIFGSKPIKTAGAPMQGPFYFIYLKPQWVLKAMPFPGRQDETMDHTDFWYGLVDSVIAPHYKISDPKVIAELKRRMPYSQPRGRVVQRRNYGGRTEWVIYHGVDFRYDVEQKRAILSAFNLGEVAFNGSVRWVPDDHHLMLKADFQSFVNLVSKIDSKNMARVSLQEPEMEEV